MKIVKIVKVSPQPVYAIQTSTGTFIADGLAHHNCYHCNINLKGNTLEYRRKIIEMYGEGADIELEAEATAYKKYRACDYEEITQKYKRLTKELRDTKSQKIVIDF